MEQTQLSLDRPTTPSNEPNRPEESEFDQLNSLDTSVSDMATSSSSVNDGGSKIDFVLSNVDKEQKEGIGHKQNLEVDNSRGNQTNTEKKIEFLNLNGSESIDGQYGNVKMELKDNDEEVVELKCTNPTSSYEEDNISLSKNSDTQPTTSEVESSRGKDCDLLLTDISRSDSMEDANANVADRTGEERCRDNPAFDADEKETTFTDGVVPVSDSEKESNDRVLNKDDREIRQINEHPSPQEDHITTDEASKTVSLMPVHFQKKVKGSDLSVTPPKKMQKRKAGTSKLCAQAGEAEQTESKCHLVPNGLCKSKDTKRMIEGSPAEDHIVNLDVVGTSNKKDEERKSDRVSVCVEDSDCESDRSSLSEGPTCWLERFRFVRKHLLTLAMALSIIFGVILGSCLRDSISSQDQRRILYLRFPGELFLNILHMLVIPLMLSTLVSNVAAMDSQSIRKLGLRSLFYYSVTTFIALVTGIILAMTAQPGKFDQLSGTGGPVPKVNPVDAVLDLLRCVKQFLFFIPMYI